MNIIIKTILILVGGFFFGCLGAFIFNAINSGIGFMLGIMFFAVLYCMLTLAEPYNNNLSE